MRAPAWPLPLLVDELLYVARLNAIDHTPRPLSRACGLRLLRLLRLRAASAPACACLARLLRLLRVKPHLAVDPPRPLSPPSNTAPPCLALPRMRLPASASSLEFFLWARLCLAEKWAFARVGPGRVWVDAMRCVPTMAWAGWLRLLRKLWPAILADAHPAYHAISRRWPRGSKVGDRCSGLQGPLLAPPPPWPPRRVPQASRGSASFH